MIDKTIVLERVQNGIAFLERAYPAWMYSFTLDDILELDINDPRKCVLAVIARNMLGIDKAFYDLKNFWGLSYEDVSRLGFYGELNNKPDLDYDIAYVEALTDVWVSIIVGVKYANV